MKKIGFVGAYDKSNLILYVAKLLVKCNLKLLIVDGTILQRTRYTVPCIKPSKSYITTYEDVDVAIGFKSINEIETYLGKSILSYDIVFIDIDSRKYVESFEIFEKTDKNYFVTAFDSYSLKKGLEVIGKSAEKKQMTKILFSRNISKTEDEYLNFMSLNYGVKWDKENIYFPFESGDDSVIIENQRNARISYKELSSQYKEGILQMISQIAPELKIGEIKKMLKSM